MTSPTRLMPLYGGLLAAAVGIFLLIRWYGETLVAGLPASAAPVVGASPAGDVLPHVLLALGAVILIGRALGRLLRPLRQPPVIGEILAGILLGPSLLGPNLSSRIIPPDAASAVGVVAQLGVILFMFIVGLELDLGLLRRRAPTAIVISHAGIVVPFLLGAATAAIVYPRLATEAVSFTIFALFLGIVMAITAFPVLARILTDQGLERTPLGTLAPGYRGRARPDGADRAQHRARARGDLPDPLLHDGPDGARDNDEFRPGALALPRKAVASPQAARRGAGVAGGEVSCPPEGRESELAPRVSGRAPASLP